MGIKNSPLFIALLAAVLYIPFLGNVHLFDWDEINFAESAREMLVTQSFFRVQINFLPFWEKPPFFFWLQAFSMQLFGINEFAARLPNAICGMLTLALLFHIGKKTMSVQFAWLWVLFMAGSVTPSLYFKTGIIDPWFNLFIFYAIWQLSLAATPLYKPQRTKYFLLAGLSLGLAVLTKGPVALLVVGLCGLIFSIQSGFRFFFSFKQLLLLIACILGVASLWIVVEISQNGIGILTEFIAYQIELFNKPVAGHGQPWFYHPLVLLIGCFPASIFAIKGFMVKTNTPESGVFKQWMNLLFWVVLILFSMVTTKIVHYSSLCWIPLTFMAALQVDYLIQHGKTFPKWLIILLLFIGIVIGSLLTSIPLIDTFKADLLPKIKDPFVVNSFSLSAPWIGFEWLLGLLFLLTLLYASIQIWRKNIPQGIYPLLMVNAIIIPLYLAIVVPKVEVYTQGPAIEFYQQIASENAYKESLGHKSYAQYFYANAQPQTNPNYANTAWLLEGDIDKPAYFVIKKHQLKEFEPYHLTLVQSKGGFVLMKREPKP